MNITNSINLLSLLVLIGLLVAVILLIAALWRINRMMRKIEHIGETARNFAASIVPAVVNIGTIGAALQSILKTLMDHHIDLKHPKKDDK